MNSTKQRIVDTAERLFNELGTGAVSTNHIAAEMGISPGNLYYHFANKDEIVATALERLTASDHAAWTPLGEGEGASVEEGLARTLSALEERRFVAREVFALALHGGPVRDRCRELVEVLAVHLSRAFAPARDDRPPESGAAFGGLTEARALVPVVLAWGSLNELSPVAWEGDENRDAAILARVLRTLHPVPVVDGALGTGRGAAAQA